MNGLEINNSIYESIKHIDENENEFQEARELQKVLEYSKWQKFNNVIKNATEACKQSNNLVEYHFTQVDKMISIAKGAKRETVDYKLSRYCMYEQQC